MVFPITPLDRTVELYLGSTLGWVDVTSYAYERDKVGISHGRPDESSGLTPATCRFTLNNKDGRFSPRNPSGPYYGVIGRNTAVRVSTKLGTMRLFAAGGGAFAATAPDTAGLSITGDIDIRADFNLPSWSFFRVLQKGSTAGQISYRLVVGFGNVPALVWSADGTNEITASATIPMPQSAGRQAVRATLDVDNGAAGRTITFYTATTAAGPWVQLGDPVVQAGVTSIFDSTASVQVSNATGSLYSVEIRQGIGGTVRANPDFTAQTEGATSFADGAGNTWTLDATAALTTRRYRFYGEITAWPQAWNVAGTDVWTTVEASGILRRIAQGADPFRSATQRFVVKTASSVTGYWPMDDESGSTSMASGLSAGLAMGYVGSPRLATDQTFQSSNALPQIGNAVFTGYTTPATAGTIFAHFLLSVPAAGDVSGVLLRIFTTGTAARWDVIYNTGSGGTLSLQAFDATNTLVGSYGPMSYPVEGLPASTTLQLVQNGANVDWTFGPASYVAGAGFGGATTNTLVGYTVGAATAIQINPSRTLNNTVIGQVVMFSAIPDTAKLLSAVRGWIGETAGARVQRLCSEEGIAFTAHGDLSQSVAMGIQRQMSLVDLLAECEAADMGQVFESRERLGIAYRTRDSRQYQPAAVALSYGSLSELTPVEDDQRTRNDVTVTRVNGSSARATVDTGTLSTQAPPNGVGRYADSVELNLYTDSQLADQAQWRVTAGTVDEPRYPTIVARLQTAAFAASASLTTDALAAEVGDLLTVSGLPVWLPPDAVRQHVVGYTETLGAFEYDISFNCAPTAPAGMTGLWDVSGRWSPDTATLTASITSTATSFQITTPSGSPLWTTNAADFPLDVVIAGERITLSAISGTSSPQTATVSARSVNGVVKAQTAGAAIDIYDQTYYSF